MTFIEIKPAALKALKKAPVQVRDKVAFWVKSVEAFGLTEARKRPGFHDEPLLGKRKGQRSVRLNRQWRLIYVEINGVLHINVLEITPHEY